MPISYASYLRSSAWARKRQQALTRSKHRCENCGSRRRLHVHHKTYARLGDEPLSDLQVLCARCHCELHRLTQVGMDPTGILALRPEKPLPGVVPAAPIHRLLPDDAFVPAHIARPLDWHTECRGFGRHRKTLSANGTS